MSDSSDLKNETNDEEEIHHLQDKDFLAEQDKKFEELRLKLQSLKDENKRQMDVIINNLDQLMAEKINIDKTLEDLHISDHIEPPIPIEKHFNVVDYLSKVAGYDKDTEIKDFVASSESTQDAVQYNIKNIPKECNKSKINMEVEQECVTKEAVKNLICEVIKSEENVINKKDGDVNVKPEAFEEKDNVETKSEVQKDIKIDKIKIVHDNKKFLQEVNGDPTDGKQSNNSSALDK